MKIVREPEEFQALAMELRCAGSATALVPTMGAFHAGHLALMDHARELADAVFVSLFVNPTQFGPGEDLAAYPRDFERDAELARERGVDLLFAPEPGAMYPEGAATRVEVEKLSQGLCGASRPGHFRGVATVVAKLLTLAWPTAAVFGRKDWQQLAVIRRMALDLNLPTRIVGHPTVREADGLAMSSRNAYLSQAERAQAPSIHRGLLRLQRRVQEGERDASRLLEELRAFYAREMPLGEPEYLEIVDPESLAPQSTVGERALAAVAVRLRRARLIDNLLVAGSPEESDGSGS